ncbi:ankyrin repeat-containing domain protein [Nemania sp. FL0031]|nr:ankyrin repeat-containing domain protein [Nemania sp. FL0031]
MSRKISKLSDQQWDDHKALIRKWYLVDDNSLEEVRSKLENNDLDATTHQIQTKIKKWKFRKNIDKKTWISIDHRITKRKRDGKESEVIFCGKRMKPETVTRETDRHGDRSTLAQLALQRNSSLPPLTDCLVAVCTPQPINMEFEWPATLPWLGFSSRELPMMLKVCKPFTLESQNASSSELVSAILPEAPRTDMAHIGVSKLAAIIGRSMPETYPQENLQRAQNLLIGPAEDFVREYVSMVIYNVSNNILDLEQYYTWDQTVKTLEDCGIFHFDFNLRRVENSTINGFMENLLNATILRSVEMIQCYNYKDDRPETIIKWLVTSGYCPNAATETLWSSLSEFGPDISPCTQQLIIGLTKYLLNAGASANILVTNHCGFWEYPERQTILEIALLQDWSSDALFNFVELLFKHGASKNIDRALHSAIRRRDQNLVEMLVHHEGDLTAGLEPWFDSPLHKETALTVAASMDLQLTQYILDLISSRYPSTSVITFITPDVLIAAAAEGHSDIIQYLYTISPTIMANEYGITPLHATARFGHPSTCQLLWSLQIAPNTWAAGKLSPLHAACYGGHKDVVEFLTTRGADVNAAPRFDSSAEEFRFTRRFAVNMNMSDYPSGKAPLNFVLDRWNTLDERKVHDFLSCAAILIRAGAKLIGSELSIAAECCHLELLAAGIAAGANPNTVDKEGKTALQCALQGSSRRSNRLYDIVSQLLSNGAQLLGGEFDSAINIRQWKVAALLCEHGGGNITKIKSERDLEEAILLEDNIRAATLFNMEPSIYSAGALFAAIAMGNDSLIQSLILNRPAETGEDPFEITAIAVAAMSGNLVLLQNLLAHPPSCHNGPLPLEIHSSCVDRLIGSIRSGRYELGGRLDPRNRHNGWPCGSPLALVASSMRSDALEAGSLLLRSGFRADELTWIVAAFFDNTAFVQVLLNHNQRSDYDYGKFKVRGPLEFAIGNCNEKMIDLLLAAGADANGSRPYVGGPLLAAVAEGDLDLVHKLVQAGADVNAYNQLPFYRSPLQKAVEEGQTDILYYLVQAGADVNGPPAKENGATALQFAAITGDLGLAKYLIDEGAQVNAPPSRKGGRTALQGAAEHGRLDMLEFLLIEGALTTGRWRRRSIKAVKLAITEYHFTAAAILAQHVGLSEEDKRLLFDANVNFDTDSEGDELDTDSDEDVLDADPKEDELEEDEGLLFDMYFNFDPE